MQRADLRASAAALAYLREDAPSLGTRERELLARTIVGEARKAGLFVHESVELVSVLVCANWDRRIPAALYDAIAGLLAWVGRLEREAMMPDAAGTRRLPVSQEP